VGPCKGLAVVKRKVERILNYNPDGQRSAEGTNLDGLMNFFMM